MRRRASIGGRSLAATAIVVASAVIYPVAVLVIEGTPRFPSRADCVRGPQAGQSLEVVFGRRDTPAEAEAFLDRVVGVGFKGTKAAPDGCGRYKIVLGGVPSVEVGIELQREAESAALPTPSIERGG